MDAGNTGSGRSDRYTIPFEHDAAPPRPEKTLPSFPMPKLDSVYDNAPSVPLQQALKEITKWVPPTEN